MRPHPVATPADCESDLFRDRLDNLVDMRHELVRLSGLIDWRRFDEAFGALYVEKGRPGLATRLRVARCISSSTRAGFRPSRSARSGWRTPTSNISARPISKRSCRTSMSVWRGRIGPERLEALIAETLAAAKRAGAVEPSQIAELEARRSPLYPGRS